MHITNMHIMNLPTLCVHGRVRRFQLKFFSGSKRNCFRSHFPCFERKRVEQPTL